MSFAYKDLDKDKVFKKLMCYGLFPQSIDKIVLSEKYGNFILKNINDNNLKINRSVKFNLLPYKLTRNNNAPRYLGIPHPLAYTRLCKIIKENWDRIDESIGKDNPQYNGTSMIVPKIDNKKKRLISLESYDKNPEEEIILLKKQLNTKYFVNVDISNFFSSIYSHSIPWALIGKEKAKFNQNASNDWYNRIDKGVRAIKNNETNGIPIGPDTSNIVSEILLSQIDKYLLNKKYNYIRFIDDYKCYCKSKDKVDNFIKDLSSQLEKYQLTLNTRKTEIVELPKIITDDWVRQLRNFSFSKNNKIIFKEAQDYLDLSISLSKEKGDYSPFKYAVKVLKNKQFIKYLDYKKIILYISNIVYIHPYIIDIFDILISKSFNVFPNHKNDLLKSLKKYLSLLLPEHITFGRSDVIVWGLFLAIKYKITIKDLGETILDLDDPLPTLLSFLYSRKNNFNTDKYFEKLKNVDQKEWWLYIYELYRLDDVRVKNIINDFKYENFYKWIKSNNITFLSDTLRP